MNPSLLQTSHHSAMMESNANSIAIKKLSRYSKSELTKLLEKNLQMLSNQSMVATLPDKGAKLKETNQIIQQLLLNGSTTNDDEITVENTSGLQDCPLTRKLEEMSVLTPHQGARKRSVDLANQQAFNHYTSSGLLLSKPKSADSATRTSIGCSSVFYSNHYYRDQNHPSMYHTNGNSDHSKVRMLTLDESMTLQTEQRSSVIRSDEQLDFNKPSRSLLNSLNLSIDLIQDVDINDVELPQDNEDSEEEDQLNHDVEAMVID